MDHKFNYLKQTLTKIKRCCIYKIQNIETLSQTLHNEELRAAAVHHGVWATFHSYLAANLAEKVQRAGKRFPLTSKSDQHCG
jgi:hypothetical protein